MTFFCRSFFMKNDAIEWDKKEVNFNFTLKTFISQSFISGLTRPCITFSIYKNCAEFTYIVHVTFEKITEHAQLNPWLRNPLISQILQVSLRFLRSRAQPSEGFSDRQSWFRQLAIHRHLRYYTLLEKMGLVDSFKSWFLLVVLKFR